MRITTAPIRQMRPGQRSCEAAINKSMEEAADALLEDCKSDKELAVFISIDFESSMIQADEHFIIKQNDVGLYLCPVCGSPAFNEPLYDEKGSASFQMCLCGYKLAFDLIQ